MKTAGLILDFYDDSFGSILKESFPTPEELPNIIKHAHILSKEERDILRNEAYALVMSNDGTIFRKFACVDAGNTALSVLYYAKNKDKLPEEAQKIAEANLAAACKEFGIISHESIKTAAKALVRTRDSFKQPLVGDEADWAQRTNLLSVRGGHDAGRVVPTANAMKTASILDVSDKEPIHSFEEIISTRFALEDKYPLNSYADVQKAIEYFSENYVDMGPEDRHTYSVKTTSRAQELGIEVPDLMSRYGSTWYAPDIEAHLANRRAHCESDFVPVYKELEEKRAHISPEIFAELLTQADEASNLHWLWGGEVCDPYYATFGGNPEKEKVAAFSWQSRTGDYVTGEALRDLARNGRKVVHKHFSSEITDAFQKDPLGVFNSLPDTSKILLARMAMDMDDPYPTN
jgi:hypothetical protein